MFEKKLYPRTVCPYIVKDGKLKWDCSDELIQWVYENRKNEKVTIEKIKQEFERMQTFFSDFVNANGEIIEKSEKSDETKKNTESEAESKLIEGIDVNAKPETAPISPKQGRKTAKPKAASKSSKQVEEKVKSKAVPSAQKQGRKKKDSDKKEAKSPKRLKQRNKKGSVKGFSQK
jgi:cobalamin biosynthesis Mg chelatase CobN